jgi:hypothetical protein
MLMSKEPGPVSTSFHSFRCGKLLIATLLQMQNGSMYVL